MKAPWVEARRLFALAPMEGVTDAAVRQVLSGHVAISEEFRTTLLSRLTGHRGGRAAWLTPAISLLIVPPSGSAE